MHAQSASLEAWLPFNPLRTANWAHGVQGSLRLLHEQILDALNLTHTYFIPDEPTPAKLVPRFDRDLASLPGMLDIGTDNTSWASSAFTSGALASTAVDLGIFYENLCAGRLMSAAMMKEMTSNHFRCHLQSFKSKFGYGPV